jgi:hypothetical protein
MIRIDLVVGYDVILCVLIPEEQPIKISTFVRVDTHQVLVLSPSRVPEKVGVNQESDSHKRETFK